MGHTLTELEKNAVKFPALRELAFRLGSPLKGLTKGWQSLSPTKLIQEGGSMGQGIQTAVNRTGAAQEALRTGGRAQAMTAEGKPLMAFPGFLKRPVEYSGESLPGKARAFMATKLRAGTHLAPDAEISKGVKGLAERASRSGWTGEGAITKYLPVGQKGMIAAGGAASVPSLMDAAEYGPAPGGSGFGEQLGSLAGFTLPAVLFGGMPTASFVAPLLGMYGGGKLGRKLDRVMDPRARQVQMYEEEMGG